MSRGPASRWTAGSWGVPHKAPAESLWRGSDFSGHSRLVTILSPSPGRVIERGREGGLKALQAAKGRKQGWGEETEVLLQEETAPTAPVRARGTQFEKHSSGPAPCSRRPQAQREEGPCSDQLQRPPPAPPNRMQVGQKAALTSRGAGESQTTTGIQEFTGSQLRKPQVRAPGASRAGSLRGRLGGRSRPLSSFWPRQKSSWFLGWEAPPSSCCPCLHGGGPSFQISLLSLCLCVSPLLRGHES